MFINNDIILHIKIDIILDMINNMNIHKKIWEFVKKNRVVTSSEVAKHFEISWNTADKYLLELAYERKLSKIKKEGVNLWMIEK